MDMTQHAKTTAALRCGFVALVGRPNVGKSTLLNTFLGSKVAIVTPKPQTTRTRIQGIVTTDAAQVIFVDTPGFCRDGGPMAKALRQTAGSAAADADLNVLVIEVRGATPEFSDADEEVFKAVRRAHNRCIVAINKTDAMPRKETLLPWMAAITQRFADCPVLPISARTGEGLDALWETIVAQLPEGPMLYPEDAHTDQAERVICSEMVREQLLLQTQQEVPHGAAVTIESFEDSRESPAPICRIEARIYVERESQKPIVIGRGGRQIKAIGQAARRHMERMLGCQVYLGLTVHVDKQWTAEPAALRRYGLMAEASR
jgi:GTP-binding protein Era